MDSSWPLYVFLFLLFFGGSIAGWASHFQSRRQQFKLNMAKEKTKLAKAEADKLAAQNAKTSLEVRKAELEIERFDRRIPGLPHVPTLGDPGEVPPALTSHDGHVDEPRQV